MDKTMSSSNDFPGEASANSAGYASPNEAFVATQYHRGYPTVSQSPPPAYQVSTQYPVTSAQQIPASVQSPPTLLVTTTDGIDGKRISQYLGVVAGEVVLGTSITKDIKGSVRGFVGGRSSSYEKEIRQARQLATQEMVLVAQQMGATAVVGVSYSYVTVNALVMVAATGTAVRTEDL